MIVIWWMLYILGALTIFIVWTQIMALVGTYLRARRERMEGAYSGMSRKDIEALVRMEITAYMMKEDK